MHHHATRGHHIHDADAGLCCDGAKYFTAGRRLSGDFRPRAFEIPRIEHIDRNVLVDRGKQRSWMKDLRAEVGELGGFIKADLLDRASIRTEARISGHHAFDVSPDLDTTRIEGSANNRGRIIRAAASEG